MSNIYNAIMGAIVGDAYGLPAKNQARGTVAITGMNGGGTFNQEGGTWSSNGALILATIESVGRENAISRNDLLYNFRKQYPEGIFSATGKVIDNDIEKEEPRINALGHIIPVAAFTYNTDTIIEITNLTDANTDAHMACLLYIMVCKKLIDKENILDIVKQFARSLWTEDFTNIGRIENLSLEEVRSTDNIVDTLIASIWCIYKTSSYKNAVKLATMLGGNTNTLAAAVGGMAGIIYGVGGENGILEEWIEKLPKKEWIDSLIKTFEESVKTV